MSATTVGWDTTLSDRQSAWSTPVDGGANTTNDANDLNAAIDKTREVKMDANDYSRFKDIGADLPDETKPSSTPAPVAPVPETCRNCHKSGAKLKCSVCKKASYCARACQASDWTFHKRICKKPEPEKKPEPPRKRPTSSEDSKATAGSSGGSASSSSSMAAAKPSKSSSAGKKPSSASTTEVVVDEPDLPKGEMRGYKNGMPYFHRELSVNEQKLIGDIAPKKVEVAPEAAKSVVHAGSAWNHAGTFEERTFTKWATDKLTELYTSATWSEGPHVATLSVPQKITGDASICVVRGKKRFLFDFAFKLPFEVQVGGAKYKGSYQLNEISNDEDYEITSKLTKKPTDAAQAAALQKFVAGGLQKEVVRIVGEFYRQFQEQ